MSKSIKELAFIRDLYIEADWTERFTDIVDEHLKLPKKGRFLYFNIGTGNHALALREKLKPEVELFGISENKETLKIAEAKAKAVNAEVEFQTSDNFSAKNFQTVLADAMLVKPNNLTDFLVETVRIAQTEGEVMFFLPTAGSFSEIFSLLWEILFNDGLGQSGAEVERFITEIPTVSNVEEMAQQNGLEKIETTTKIEIFEYDTGAEFTDSRLVQDFLLPAWLDSLSEKEKKQVAKKLAQIIDAERDGLTFRFSVKATLVTGQKSV
jgi:ubiquinone/menaquinone biosynthesis C-methylase UbiE